MDAHRPAGADKAESARVSAIIVQLRDVAGLSYAQIVYRLSRDFGIELSRTAVWQRYRRSKHDPL